MSDTDNFDSNPFRALDSTLFPVKSKERHAAGKGALENMVRHPPRRRMSEHGQIGQNDEDSRLFLSAMSKNQYGNKPPSAAEHRGCFRLEEQCALPGKCKGKKKRGKGAFPASETESPVRSSHNASKTETVPRAADDILAHMNALCGEEDEETVFLQAMAQVNPLHARGRDVAPTPSQSTPPPQGEISLQDFMDGKLEFALSFTDEYLEGHVVGLDQMIMNKLRAGSLSPEAHLDLHGLNAVQAFEALRGFMRGSWYKGLRTVLVVPGRGRNSPDGVGILREKLQRWLTQDPFKRVVLAFCTARPHDGGPGSVYVLLRKYRKKGHIYWERLPADSDLF